MMSKYMLLKSFLAFFILSGFSCAKKDPKNVSPKSELNLTTTNKTSSADTSTTKSPSTDTSKAVKNSADSTMAIASSSETSKANSADSTKVVKNVSQDQTKAQIISTDVENFQDSQTSEAEKTALLKVKVLNQKMIEEILNQENKVVYKSKLTEFSVALEDLKNGNEDSFCKLTGHISFDEQKMIAMTAINKKLVDKAADIYETEITLINKNKKASLNCVHTTSNFYIEQFALNMAAYFEVWSDAKKMETQDFKNPRTLNRQLNAVKIKNLKMLQEASHLEVPMALASGRLVTEGESLDLLKSGKERTACVVSEISKDLDISKVYIRVDKMMGSDKYKDVIAQHTVYRADKDNYFVFQCLMNKKSGEWYDLMSVAQGVLEFGVLNRNEYNKSYDQIKAMNEKLKSED